MSFSFGFTNNELSDDELVDTDTKSNLNTINSVPDGLHNELPLYAEWLTSPDIAQPKIISLNELLDSLRGVRLTFEVMFTPNKNVRLYRRELFDVKHQLMSEATDVYEANTSNTELEILMGDTNEDLRKNVYEGGLKCWECSIDLVDHLALGSSASGKSIIELGCGTALPAQYLFSSYLSSDDRNGLRILLSDYNDSVLRLVTLPNLIVSWAKHVLSEEQWASLQRMQNEDTPVHADELLLTDEVLAAFKKDMENRRIELSFVSGTWSIAFVNLLREHQWSPSKDLVILTSETIYQPDTLPIIADLILELMSTNKAQSQSVIAYVAAKDIYFGVGGSIIEFEHYVREQIHKNGIALKMTSSKVNTGLKRSIVTLE
ncbi:HFL335Cp [Eremothecium sinecaudum]|uniref:protein-histidine N-methyltransferase n=1 Tax=Eremothecium sinecaudum TaxID=45286 RepID=A0A0X8HTH3_9SACH|nr:HFL335Cp [Eremothecium sinecaudum]AMD21521.1 HFL335Cp [Eremothecium sinecaudum]